MINAACYFITFQGKIKINKVTKILQNYYMRLYNKRYISYTQQYTTSITYTSYKIYKTYIFAYSLIIVAVAIEAIPSPLPVKPSRSVVVAFTDTASTSTPRSAATLARICSI